MSDTYNSILDSHGAFQRAATTKTVGSLDDDPDQAARAIRLGEATNTPSSVVFGDVDNFDRQHKAALASDIVKNNSFISDYVNSHPLAASVSNDDYGQLDAVSAVLRRLPPPFSFGSLALASIPETIDIAKEGLHALARIPAILSGTAVETPEEKAFSANILRYLQAQGVTQEQAQVEVDVLQKRMQRGEVIQTGLFGLPTLALSPVFGMYRHFISGPLERASGFPKEVTEQFTMVALATLGLKGMASQAKAAHEAVTMAEPWLKEGKKPPAGLHPILDAAEVEQTKLDVQKLSNALGEAIKSTTRERAPPLFANFIRQHNDGKIGISADAVRELYGEKVPTADDGILGWVPRINEQLESALAVGGDIEVSVADWLAKVDPSVAKQLEEHIRPRDGGVTLEEGKNLPKEAAETATPVDAIRQASGLEPLLPRPGAKFTIKPVSDKGDSHSFTVHNAKDEALAELFVTEEAGGKRLYVDDFRGIEGQGPGDLGTRAIMETANQLFEQFPNVDEIRGLHVSGAKGKLDTKDLKETVIKRPKAEEPKPTTKAEQLELPAAGTTRMEDREVFATAAANGMTKDSYQRYMALIEKRRAEDQFASLGKVMANERKRQTVTWKADRTELRKDVAAEVSAQPRFQADEILRGKTKLSMEALTDEQIASLPKDYVAKDGIDPDSLASHLGYSTGDQLVRDLSALTKQRDEAGMKHGPFLERVIEAETDRQMEAKYGKLDENILRDAKDQVLSETQLDLMHEELLALAAQADVELSLTKDQIRTWAKDEFSKQKVGSVSSDKYLADAGRATREIELALLKGDPQEAFKQGTRRNLATIMANEAKTFEKAMAQFDKRADRFSKRDVLSVATDYVNYIQSALVHLDRPVKRPIHDLAEAIEKEGHKSFADFVDTKEAGLRDLHVPDFMRDIKPDSNLRQPLEGLTVEQFRQVNDMMKAMEFNGRDELKINKAGENFELNEVINEMVEKIKSLGPAKEHRIDRPVSKVIDVGKSYWWSGINVESMLNRIDRDNPRGIFSQFVIREFTSASNYKDKLIREYQAKISELGKIEGMDKLVENDLFIDPHTHEPLILRRRNVLGILQNAGNANNLMKLAKGYGLEPESVMSWLLRNTTKEDWDRAQKIGNLFNELFEKANTMSHTISGVSIQKLPLSPIETPFGTYAGWYNPIKYDPLRPGKSKRLLGPDTEQEGFYRATTPQGYTEQRTGYIAPVELNLDIVPIRMKQMIHDIAMRPAVLQLSKVFYNDRIKDAMIAHFGRHQAEEMIPFLRDIANSANFKSLSAHLGEQAIEYFRQNTIATLIGFNPGTVAKHGTTALGNSINEVGIVPFAREFASLVTMDEATGKRNWSMAMEKSEELQRRMRNYSELISGHGSEINIRGGNSNFTSYRNFMMSAGATPVAISDLLSAMPTWLAKYKAEKAAGSDEGMAVSIADRAVRRAHGSSVLSNKPSIMRTNALGATFSSLYGFFSHMQQKHYEMAWKARDMYADVFGKGSGDIESGARHVPDLIKGFISYIVIPAAIEEIVTPYTNSERDSWGMMAAKALIMGTSSSLVGVRDFVRALINFREPQAGLIGASLKAGTDLAHDLSKGKQAFTKEKAGNLIKHSAALAGVLTGFTNVEEGRIGEYLFRYSQGLEKPKGLFGDKGVLSGLRHGRTDRKH